MTDIRHVSAEQKKEGEGASVDRAFPTDSFARIDPFVLLDDFRVEPPHGFPEHTRPRSSAALQPSWRSALSCTPTLCTGSSDDDNEMRDR